MWGRLSSLRPAFQPALFPSTHRPLFNPIARLVEHAVLRATPAACAGGWLRRLFPPPAAGHAPPVGQDLVVMQPLLVEQAAGVGQSSLVGKTFLPAAGFPAGLGPLYPPPSVPPNRSPRASSRQACHAGPSWSKPPGLPCRRSRRQSYTYPIRTGLPNAIRPARLRAPPQAAAAKWSKPPGLAHRQPCAGGWFVPVPHRRRGAGCFRGVDILVWNCRNSRKLLRSFPPLPPPLEIAARFPHSHSFDYGDLQTHPTQNRKEPSGHSTPILQAHPSMRKC